MLNLLKTSAVAAVVATAPFAASASTFIADDATTVLSTPGTYVFDGLVLVGSGDWNHTFDLTGAANGGEGFANVTVGGQVNQFDNLTMAWLAADSMIVQESTVIADANLVTLGTTFSTVGAQILRISWDDTAASDGQGFDLEVTVEVAAVPVPAAGLMLLTALGGAAALRRRK